MHPQDPVTTAIAVYGAALSTCVAYFQILARRPRVEVKLDKGFEVVLGEDASGPLIMWDIINKGSFTVRINTIYLELPKGSAGRLLYPDVLRRGAFPAVIEAQSNLHVSNSEEGILNALRKNHISGQIMVQGCAKDATGRIYKSKSFKLEVA